MTDYFAVLGQLRRPWLDAEQLKDAFLARSNTVHPDRVHSESEATRQAADERYAELNAAYQCLRQPKARLAHLLLLERNSKPGDLRDIPGDVALLFGEVGTLLREATSVIAEKGRAASAIQKAGVLTGAVPVLERIQATQANLQNRMSAVEVELRMLDRDWPNTGGDAARREQALATAERLYHLLGFMERWSSQLQECVVRITI